MSIQLRSTVQQYAPPNPLGLLDIYPSDVGGWSLRRLRRDQEVCLRLRRTSDNVLTDIGFVYNPLFEDYWLDEQAIINFCGESPGDIVSLYCQNGSNAVGTTGVPWAFHDDPSGGVYYRIYDGSQILKNLAGRPHWQVPHVDGTWVGWNNFANAGDAKSYLGLFAVSKPTYSSGTTYGQLFRFHGSGSNRAIFQARLYHSAPTNVWVPHLESNNIQTTATPTGRQAYGTNMPRGSVADSIQVCAWTDYTGACAEYPSVGGRGISGNGYPEVTSSLGGAPGVTATGIRMGFDANTTASYQFLGNYAEVIIYRDNSQHINRANISLNQMLAFGITPYVAP